MAAAKPQLERFRERGNLEVYAAVIVAGLTYLGIRFLSFGYLLRLAPAGSIPTGNWMQHALLVGKSLASYALLIGWPFGTLSPIHYSQLPISTTEPASWIALVLDGLILLGLIRWVRRAPSSGWLAVGGTLALLPVLNILPLQLGGGAFIAERFVVFPVALTVLAVTRGLLSSSEQPSRQSEGPAQPERRGSWAISSLWLLAAVATVQLTLPNWRDNVTLWNWAASRAPRSATPYTNLALEYTKMGQYEVAQEVANHALELDPGNADAWDNLGLARFYQADYAEAQTAFERAVALQPENALFWNNMAGALREQDLLVDAEKILVDQSLRLDPTLPAGHLNLGLVYLRADRPDLALPHLEQAMRLLPPEEVAESRGLLDLTRDPARWLRLGELLLDQGDAEGAKAAFSQARDLGAEAADTAVGLSAALIEQRDWENAERVLLEAVQVSAGDARVYNNLGVVAREKGDRDLARSYFERAVVLAPDWDLPRTNLEALSGSP